jgi:hypothetical protein
MLAALMEDGVLRQGQGGLVVHPELHYFCVTAELTRGLESKRLWQRCTPPRNWTEPPLAA